MQAPLCFHGDSSWLTCVVAIETRLVLLPSPLSFPAFLLTSLPLLPLHTTWEARKSNGSPPRPGNWHLGSQLSLGPWPGCHRDLAQGHIYKKPFLPRPAVQPSIPGSVGAQGALRQGALSVLPPARCWLPSPRPGHSPPQTCVRHLVLHTKASSCHRVDV